MDGIDPQLVRTRSEEHLSFTFRHNVVSYRTGNLLGENWNNDSRYVMDDNLYWRRGQPVLFGQDDLDGWRKRGHDERSIIADPRFVDPAKDDFRFQPDSPALKIGCPSLDVRQTGCSLPEAKIPRDTRERRAFPGRSQQLPVTTDFESVPAGSPPVLPVASGASTATSARVTDQTADRGRKSLELPAAPPATDQPASRWFCEPNFWEGVIAVRFSLRHERGAVLEHVWHDRAKPPTTGPSLRLEADGTLRSRDRVLGKLPEGKWLQFEIRCKAGWPVKGSFELDVREAGATKALVQVADVDYGKQFQFVRWIGFSAGTNSSASCFLDAIDIRPILEPTPSIPLADNNSVAAPKMLLDSAGEANLVDWGFNGEVSGSIMGMQTFDAFAPGLMPEGSPEYYLTVTDAIEPHPNLIFSVKHQKGDFHQLTAFNPTLMIGKHPQIIEVQSQREAYGKGAHPYYIGQGVIEGWEEYAWMMKPGEPRGLRDVVAHPLYAGVWIWSRGGGWEGPTHQERPVVRPEQLCGQPVRAPSRPHRDRRSSTTSPGSTCI